MRLTEPKRRTSDRMREDHCSDLTERDTLATRCIYFLFYSNDTRRGEELNPLAHTCRQLSRIWGAHRRREVLHDNMLQRRAAIDFVPPWDGFPFTNSIYMHCLFSPFFRSIFYFFKSFIARLYVRLQEDSSTFIYIWLLNPCRSSKESNSGNRNGWHEPYACAMQ